MDKRSVQLALAVLRHSHLQPFVREIEVVHTASRDQQATDERFYLGRTVQQLLERCSNVKKLQFPRGFEESSMVALEAPYSDVEAPAMEELKLSPVGYGWAALARASKTKLRRLEVVPWANTGPTRVRLAVLPDLLVTSLRVSYWGEEPCLPLDAIFLSVKSTVTHLELNLSLARTPPLDLFPHLTHLRLLVPLENKATFLAEFPRRLLPKCTTLHTLAIAPVAASFTLSNIRTLSSNDYDGLAYNLPSSLVALHLESPHFLPADLVSIITGSPNATSLRHLGRQAYRLPRSERDRRKRPSLPTHDEEEELQVACARKGIKLVELF
jgi:hypothetical protein